MRRISTSLLRRKCPRLRLSICLKIRDPLRQEVQWLKLVCFWDKALFLVVIVQRRSKIIICLANENWATTNTSNKAKIYRIVFFTGHKMKWSRDMIEALSL
jgi:hypothetical protein